MHIFKFIYLIYSDIGLKIKEIGATILRNMILKVVYFIKVLKIIYIYLNIDKTLICFI